MRTPSLRPLPSRLRPHWAGELVVISLLVLVYDRVADLASVRSAAAFRHGRQILGVERAFHVAVEHPAQSLLAALPFLSKPAALWYDFAHMTVTVGVLLAVWLYRPAVYRRLRNVLVVINLLGLSVFLLYPVAPPRLLPGAGFTDVVAQSHTPGSWDSSARLSQHANVYASAPSLHVAYALWVLLAAVLCTRRTWLRSVAAAQLALTTGVVLCTGNHYLLDVATGGLAVLLSWWLTWPVAFRRATVATLPPQTAQPAPPPCQRPAQLGPPRTRVPVSDSA